MLGDEAVTNLIVELLPPGGRVLDVGCGGGHTLRALTRRGVEGMGIVPTPTEGLPAGASARRRSAAWGSDSI